MYEIFSKIKSLLKKKSYNRLYTIVWLILLYMTHYNIYLCGDDFMYGTFSHGNILFNVSHYYITGNGRWLINILDSLLLYFDRYLFLVINPLLIVLFTYLLSKVVIELTNKKEFNEIYQISLLLVCSINILMSRETVYWITGMMNYLFPAILMFAVYYFYLSNKRLLKNNMNIGKQRKVLFLLLSFLAGASVEQFSLMTCGLLFLDILYRIIKREKIYKIEIYGLILAIIGLTSILVAPGNFNRVEAATNYGQSLIVKLIDLVHDNYYSAPVKYYICILSVLSFFFIREQNLNKFCICTSFFNMILSVLRLFFDIFFESGYLVLINFIIFILTILIILFYAYREDNNVSLLSLLFVGVGSQIMLLISIIWGFRICFSMYIIYFILIMYLYAKIKYQYKYWLIAGVLLCQINIIFVILLIVPYTFRCNRHSILSYSVLFNLFFILIFQLTCFNGYLQNSETHKINISEATSDKTNITIYSFKNDIYGWTNPPLGEFHERYFREYYKIKDDVEIHYNDIIMEEK